jgi:hypothetical protein
MDLVLNMHNTASVAQLMEARVHLDALVSKLEVSPIWDDEDFGLSIYFQHILEHVVLAWHFRRKSDEEAAQLSQDEFNKLCSSIPNFGYALHLLDGLDAEPSGSRMESL